MKLNPAAYLILVAAAGSLFVLQGIFDRADLEKSEKLVRAYHVGATTVDALIDSRHPARLGPPRWSAEILSSCRGTVRVTCVVSDAKGESVYRFDVDLPQQAIHPGDAAGRSLLVALERASSPHPGP